MALLCGDSLREVAEEAAEGTHYLLRITLRLKCKTLLEAARPHVHSLAQYEHQPSLCPLALCSRKIWSGGTKQVAWAQMGVVSLVGSGKDSCHHLGLIHLFIHQEFNYMLLDI